MTSNQVPILPESFTLRDRLNTLQGLFQTLVLDHPLILKDHDLDTEAHAVLDKMSGLAESVGQAT